MLLRELGLLITAGHALDNAGREVTSPFLRYSDDWSDKEREQAFSALDAFINDSVILPEVIRGPGALEHLAGGLETGTYKLDDEVEIESRDLRVIAEFAAEMAGSAGRMEDHWGLTTLPILWSGLRRGAQGRSSDDVTEGVERARGLRDEQLRWWDYKSGETVNPPSDIVGTTVRDVRDFVDRRWLRRWTHG